MCWIVSQGVDDAFDVMVNINKRLQVNGTWDQQLEIYHTKSTAPYGAVGGNMAKAQHLIKTTISFAARGILINGVTLGHCFKT